MRDSSDPTDIHINWVRLRGTHFIFIVLKKNMIIICYSPLADEYNIDTYYCPRKH